MIYVEMTIEEAINRCNKHDKVLVAIQDLEKDGASAFSLKRRGTYFKIFEDIKSASSAILLVLYCIYLVFQVGTSKSIRFGCRLQK